METCVIALTGGPCGGKSTLIRELSNDAAWRVGFSALPEAISMMGDINIPPNEKLFQRIVMQIQMGMEDALKCALEAAERRLILCHRGSLDPLAYWLDRGWPEDEFFAYTETRQEEHYMRYAAVIHLVTAADGAEQVYRRWPEDRRHETAEHATRLDRLLGRAWERHPNYVRLGNEGQGWEAKSRAAREILRRFI